MTAQEMADLMARNHPGGLGWSAAGIAAMLEQPSVVAVTHADGFAMLRVTGPEAEILTVEVRPQAQGRGVGTWLLAQVMDRARGAGVTELHLEVAHDNAPARRLYAKAGFDAVGTRPGYYRMADGSCVDALLMRRGLEPWPPLAAPDTGTGRS
jgi:ribosomal-protein-alanine N-acetyltransferase